LPRFSLFSQTYFGKSCPYRRRFFLKISFTQSERERERGDNFDFLSHRVQSNSADGDEEYTEIEREREPCGFFELDCKLGLFKMVPNKDEYYIFPWAFLSVIYYRASWDYDWGHVSFSYGMFLNGF